jgi:hypothetical protein
VGKAFTGVEAKTFSLFAIITGLKRTAIKVVPKELSVPLQGQ